MDYTILVNKKNIINENQIPKELEIVGKNFWKIENVFEEDFVYLEKIAAFNFNKMIRDCNTIFKSEVIPDSGYRSIEDQKKILKYYLREDQRGEEAYNTVALPYTSEHHTGLAIDVAIIKDGKYSDDITGDEPEIKWLHNNCFKYGFILRYPKNKVSITGYNYEPWHFRYVGLDIAEKIWKNNLALEEYYLLNFESSKIM